MALGSTEPVTGVPTVKVTAARSVRSPDTLTSFMYRPSKYYRNLNLLQSQGPMVIAMRSQVIVLGGKKTWRSVALSIYRSCNSSTQLPDRGLQFCLTSTPNRTERFVSPRGFNVLSSLHQNMPLSSRFRVFEKC